MTTTIFKTIAWAALLLAISVPVIAQQGTTLDDSIKTLNDSIAKLEATPVLPSMQATHRQNINELRVDLIALLGQKKGEMVSYISAVSANLRADQRDRLAQQVNDLDNQIALQKRALQGVLSSTVGAAAATVAANNLTGEDERPEGVTVGNETAAVPPNVAAPSQPPAVSSAPGVPRALNSAAAADTTEANPPANSTCGLAPPTAFCREKRSFS